MPRNVEIKARLESIESILPQVTVLADQDPAEIFQDDTFFVCANGRLKLRVLPGGEGELIFYRRKDLSGPKESFYLVSPVSSPDTLRELLSAALSPAGRVRKRRLLFRTGRTRIHLDRVEGLGDFLELEVVLSDEESAEAGAAIARELLERLGIGPERLVEGAYVDLLAGADAALGAAPQRPR